MRRQVEKPRCSRSGNWGPVPGRPWWLSRMARSFWGRGNDMRGGLQMESVIPPKQMSELRGSVQNHSYQNMILLNFSHWDSGAVEKLCSCFSVFYTKINILSGPESSICFICFYTIQHRAFLKWTEIIFSEIRKQQLHKISLSLKNQNIC